ncbi:MAG: AI-2E family transporter [Patescibacteria group bacterium]
MRNDYLAKPFLIILLVLSLFACFLIFKPFLIEIVIAAVLVSFFYKPFKFFTKVFRGKKWLAAALVCILVLLIVIIPVTNLIIFSGKKSVTAYTETVNFINNASEDIKSGILSRTEIINIDEDSVKNAVLEVTKIIRDWITKGAGMIVKGTTGFVVSLVLIVLTMFFFFLDGRNMVEKLKLWSPLPNKYDSELFQKFREISYTAVISTFATAIVQGFVGAVGFLIIGLPAFYAGILIAFFSLIPYIGSMIVYVPVGIYLLLIGEVFKGLFMLAWGVIIIGNTDNIIRAYLLTGKSKINPIFIIFSLIGGLALFGFWGLIIGPLIIAISATIFHIYELEFKKELDN